MENVFNGYYGIKDIAKMLKVSEKTVYELIYSGKLKAEKLPGNKKKIYVSEAELNRYKDESKLPYTKPVKLTTDRLQYEKLKTLILADSELISQLIERLEAEQTKQLFLKLMEALADDPKLQSEFKHILGG